MSERIASLGAGSSSDPTVNAIIDFAKDGLGDTHMFGLLARRPELVKRIAPVFAYFLAGDGGLIEPQLLELMRLRGANLNACTYCATVRFQPVVDAVQPKEPLLGLIDVSTLTKAEAVAALKDSVEIERLTPRERAAIELVDRIIVDPHSVDDELYAELRRHFSEDEIIELLAASALFTWAGTLNTALRVETGAESKYGGRLMYAT